MMKGNKAQEERTEAGAPAPSLARRGHLLTRPNPSPGLDYVVTHLGRLRLAGQAPEIALCLRFVPDRLILAGDAVEAYLAALGDESWGSLEDLATAALEDLNNELVARWVHLTLGIEHGSRQHHEAHRVTLEDRQPGWDNPELLARLTPC
jgi:hypothetical protein